MFPSAFQFEGKGQDDGADQGEAVMLKMMHTFGFINGEVPCSFCKPQIFLSTKKQGQTPAIISSRF